MRGKKLLVLLLVALILPGCAQLELHYDISDQRVEIRNLVRLESETPENKALLDELLLYWQDQGYAIHTGINEQEAGARKVITTSGRRETAIFLQQHFDGKHSPFKQADFEYQRGFWADKFSFDLVLDLNQPVDPESLAEFYPGDGPQLYDGEPNLVVKISLPGRVTATNGSASFADGGSTVVWPLRLGQDNQLQLTAVAINPLPILLTVLGGTLLLSQLLLILLLRRRRGRLSV